MLRPYQQTAVQAGLYCIADRRNGIIVLPTGSGKSWVIAAVAQTIQGRLIVLQPTKEILEQNHEKFLLTGETDVGIWSASCFSRERGRTTFATIGSVIRHKELFKDCGCVIVDECHSVNAKGGMYEDFLRTLGVPVLGLTATPWRLRHYNHPSTGEPVAESRILTRTRPRVFDQIVHVTQIGELLDQGYLCPCSYERDTDYQESEIPVNSTAQGYDDKALAAYNVKQGTTEKIVAAVQKSPSRHILSFCQFRAESERVLAGLKAAGVSAAIVDGDTPKPQREQIIAGFRSGTIRVAVNVQVLGVGFDFPALDCIILGRPTKSVSLYAQQIGRGVRKSEGKATCHVIDLCDNVRRFGRIESFRLEDPTRRQLWVLHSEAGQLTGVDITTKTEIKWGAAPVASEEAPTETVPFGKYKDSALKDVPLGYLRWACEKFNSGKWKTVFAQEIVRRRAKQTARSG